MMSNIEVIIPVKNEAKNLPFALASVMEWADKVWVVDSESIDDTRDIAEKAGAEVVVQPWLGYAKQKNWAIQHLDIKENELPRLLREWHLFKDSIDASPQTAV